MNQPPTISVIGNQTTTANTTTASIAFTIADPDTPLANLTLTPRSSNTALIPNANIVLGGSGANRTVTVIPANNQTGAADITIDVSDSTTTVSRTFTLTVQAAATVAPSILAQPESQTVTAGANVSLTVTANGTAPLSYQWSKDGTAKSGATASTLSFTSVQAADAADYIVKVSNTAGSVTSAVARVTVNVPVSITTQPQSQTVIAGTNVTFTVAATGTAPLTYRWRLTKSGITTPLINEPGASLTLTNVQSALTADYDVVVANVVGSVTSAVANLTVLVPPVIRTQPQDKVAKVGDATTFNVSADGTTPLFYQWRKEGANLLNQTNASLALSNIQPGDAGGYSVVVTNFANSVTSQVASLTVLIPPGITSPPENQTVCEGANVTFRVVASGTGPLFYQWRQDGRDVESATDATLTLNNVQSANSGTYTVVVSHSTLGSTNASATLTVNTPPRIITLSTSQTVPLGGSVTFNVTVTGSNPLTYQWRTNGVAIAGATGPSLTLRNVQLSDAAAYSVVVANSCASVTSSSFNLILLTPPVIRDQPLTQSATVGGNVTFTVAADGVPPLRYQWQFNGVDIIGATASSFTLNNVQPASVGDFRVIVSNDGGSTPSEPAPLSVTFPETFSPTTQIRPEFWVVDGAVNAVAEAAGILYVGGSFNTVWPNTGSGAVIDLASGVPDGGFPDVNGEVSAVASDGSGGWYIGGNFSAVGGQARNRLAHLRPDKSLNPDWHPSADRPVRAIAVSGASVYVAGQFTKINGETRNRVAKLEAGNGALLGWNPDADGPVFALAVSDTTVFVGGQFGRVGGQSRNNAAALSSSGTGNAISNWNPGPDNTVFALAAGNSRVYLGGEFKNVGTSARSRLAAVDAANGNLISAFNPAPDFTVRALTMSGSTVYVGGDFGEIGGQSRRFVAALDSGTGSATTTWAPTVSSTATAIVVANNTVYLGGQFTKIGNETRNRIGAVNASDGALTSWNPNANGVVNVLAAFGSTIYAGGQFSVIGSQKRSRIAAFEIDTGKVTSWDPNANDTVRALVATGEAVYVGGEFSFIGGTNRIALAALDPATGKATSWDPNPDDLVFALAKSGNTIYAGGKFRNIGKERRPRSGVAALDIIQGNVTVIQGNAWDARADASARVNALAVDGVNVYVGGIFENMGGAARKNFAALDTVKGDARAWSANADSPVNALHVSGSRLYVGGDFTTLAGQSRTALAALDTASGTLISTWNPNLVVTNNVIRCSVYSVSEAQGTVYVGGVFNRVSDIPRNFIATLDAGTGVATQWRADANNQVSALLAQGLTVYAGGGFTILGGLNRSFLAAILPKGPPVITSQPHNIEVNLGESVTLRVIAIGQEPLTYQWKFNGANISGATSSSYTVSNATTNQTGIYTAVVSNSLGNVTSAEAKVTVRVAPVITDSDLVPGSIVLRTVLPGATVSFTANAGGSPPLRYQWRLNGQNISGATSPTFTIANAQATNSGSYTFAVANDFAAINSGVISLLVDPGQNLNLVNNFADRPHNNAFAGLGTGSNLNATSEPSEKDHAGKPGGKSVWFGWTAPANGIATFTTAGSGFDTLLAVYTGTSIASLSNPPVASDDESGGYHTSAVTFTAKIGTEYQIAIDGFAGASGNIMLNWILAGSENDDVPKIKFVTGDKAAPVGETIRFSVLAENKQGGVTGLGYQWYFESNAMAGETNSFLEFSNVNTNSHIGSYRCEVSIGARKIRTVPMKLEVGPQLDIRSNERIKDLAPAGSGFPNRSRNGRGKLNFASVAAGSLGTQVLDNLGSTKDLDEPNHGGVVGGSSRWFPFRPATEGTIVFEAKGFGVRPVLAIYRGTDYLNAPLVVSDNNSDGDEIATVSFQVEPLTDYVVALDTINGANGRMNLSWRMGSRPINPDPTKASLTLTNVAGTNVVSRTEVDANPTPTFQWLRPDGSVIANETSSTLTLSGLALTQAGLYKVIVSNFMGAITNQVNLTVLPPPKAKMKGKIRYYAGNKTVPGVSVDSGATGTSPVSSAADGSFEFTLDTGTGKNYMLRPTKDSDDRPDNGVTTSDITFIRRHILFLQNLDSAYAVLAADANGSGSVTTSGITFIRRVILHLDSSFPGPMWKFIRAEQTFSDLRNPWSFENNRSISAFAADLDNQDFIAVRAGDVNGSWSPPVSLQQFGGSARDERVGLLGMNKPSAATVTLQVADGVLTPLGRLSVPIRVAGFKKVTGLQFTVQWNPRLLQYSAVTGLGLTGLGPGNFGTTLTAEGKLLFSWDDPNGVGVSLADGNAIFTLELSRVITAATGASVFIGDNPTVREVTVEGVIGSLVTEKVSVATDSMRPTIQTALSNDGSKWRIGITFSTVTGRAYRLETTVSLTRPEWRTLNQVTGDGSVKTLMDDNPSDSQRFYRIRTD